VVRSLADIEKLEQRPLQDRLEARTVAGLIRSAAARDPAKVALRFLPSGRLDLGESVLSFGELVAQVDRAAQLFRALGVRRGDAVALLLPNLPQAYVALLGAMATGIAMPLNWMLRTAQLQSLLSARPPKVLVAADALCQVVEALPRGLLEGVALLRVGDAEHGRAPADADETRRCEESEGRAPSRRRWTSFEAACTGSASGPLEDPEPEDVAAYIHTGGSTGQPKLAKIVHHAIAYKCWVYRELLGQRAEHVALGVSPLFHVGGIVLRAIHPLACGMTIVVPGAAGLREREVLQRYWQIVERMRITELSAVPTSLGVLAGIDPGKADLSSVRPFAITGSSTLPLVVAQRFEQRSGVRLLCDYGLTEYTATVALPPVDGETPPGSVGLRLPYTRVRIVDARGHETSCDAIGEIQVKGPGQTAGYLDGAADATLWTGDGWARTGDLGRMDSKGFLFITGRSKDLIIRSGHNIDPRVIEETLQAHEAVALAAAVGQPDAYAGELPVAYVQLQPDRIAESDELRAFALERVPERAAAPVAVHVLDRLPLTGSGKVDKPRLREMSACATIARLARAAGAPACSVIAVADARHGTVYRVVLTAGAKPGQGDDAASPSPGSEPSLAARVDDALKALPCRCEVVAEAAMALS
jgi:fatty-acyl-CoA synthase